MPLNNPAGAKRRVKTGTYTGDNADDRQIVTGFKCAFVWIATTAAVTLACMIPGAVWDVRNGAALPGGSGLHATDGFTVYQTGDGINNGTVVYNYYAIEAD